MGFHRCALLAAATAVALLTVAPAGATSFKSIWNPQTQANGNPRGGLFRRSDGTLFGTSFGYPGHGIVFQLTPSGGSWTPKQIFGFNGTNGSGPAAGLVQDSSGAFYGTTYNGGTHGDGVVFKLVLSGSVWKETRLYSFAGGSDGAHPDCDLTRVASTGALYGTTESGGGAGEGEGTVFSLTQSNGVWSEHVLYAFGGGDGAQYPESAVHRDAKGALYGTSSYGGPYNQGIVYKLVRSGNIWKESMLHYFGGTGDGSYPIGPLIADTSGTLYGTTSGGGAHDSGTVFRLAADGSETVLWSFGNGSDGAYPIGALHMNSAGALYGTTDGGGLAQDEGTVFKLSQSGGSWTETVLHNFTGSDGASPFAGLVADSAGNLYGTTTAGGTYGFGTAFEIGP